MTEVGALSELRQDILTGEWVIFAGNRKKRPYDFIKKSVPKTTGTVDCQFCPGNERFTTDAVYQDGENGKWSIRVFPNKYPAVSGKVTDEDAGGDGFYTSFRGNGAHEVIVDTPDHFETIQDFDAGHLFRVLKVLRARYENILSRDGIKYVQIFKNCGPDAGASIMHSHWQIIGVPVVPEEQTKTAGTLKSHRIKTGECLICSVLRHERERGIRIVGENSRFTALSPYASRMSYECDIIAKEHISRFSEFDDRALFDLARLLREVLSAVRTLRKEICFNLCFEDTPKGRDGHWFMRVLPRMGNLAGFEYGTHSYINPVLPEDAAEYMRKIISQNSRG